MITNAHIVGTGIAPEDYLKQEVERGNPAYVLSRSDLVEILRCPHRWRAGYRSKESDAMDRGSLWDCLLLDKAGFATRYAIIPETYPAPAHHPKVKKGEIELGEPLPWNANAGWCEDWLSAHKNQATVKGPDLLEAQTAVARIMADPELAGIIGACDSQVMVVGEWNDRTTGLRIPLRALLDIAPHVGTPFGEWLIDYKTTTSAAMRLWARSVGTYTYHVQAWLHNALYVAATKEIRTEFAHIVQESFEPYHVEKRRLSNEFLKIGGTMATNALALYCQCLKTDEWPGYPARVVLNGWQQVEPEPWMAADAMDSFPQLVVPPEPEFVSETPT